MTKRALINGITGQHGSCPHLGEAVTLRQGYLLDKISIAALLSKVEALDAA